MDLVPAEGPILDEILASTYDIWNEGLSRRAYPNYYKGQLATAWGRARLTRTALVDRGQVLTSAKEYFFDAALDGRSIRVVGLGAVFTQPQHRGGGHARVLLQRLIDRATGHGCDLALLFSEIGPGYYASLGFTPVPTFNLELRVREDARRGAPALLVRAGDDRDLDAIVAMDRARARGYRLHLDRDRDLVQYAIAKRRLLAGLGAPGERHLDFFVAEEGASAVAYAVILKRRSMWTLDSAGDRDPAGARLGAILQTLIARDPAEARPTLDAWLPPAFRPPQIEIVGERVPKDVMMIRPLTARGTPATPLGRDEALYWRSDLF